MVPVINQFKQNKLNFDLKVCVTAQHREMLDQVLDFLNNPDFDLNIMKSSQFEFSYILYLVLKIF